MNLREKYFVDKDPITTEEKLQYATAILEIYADKNNWAENRDRYHGEHRKGEQIVLRSSNIVPGYSFAQEYFDKVNSEDLSANIGVTHKCEPKEFTIIRKWSGVWWKPWTWGQYQTMYSVRAFDLITTSLVKNPPRDCEFIND